MTEVTYSQRLNAVDASALLQRFMPRKNALEWLSHDRKIDPVIPFSMQAGNIFYDRRELEYFVSHCLVNQQPVNLSERRNRSDRRYQEERRRQPNVRLSLVAKRRRFVAPDRRASVARDRRV